MLNVELINQYFNFQDNSLNNSVPLFALVTFSSRGLTFVFSYIHMRTHS